MFPLVRHAAIAAIAAVLALPAPLAAESGSGAYLAARRAASESDYASAAHYFSKALAQDPGNATLLENVVLAQLSLGELQRAYPVAQEMEAKGLRSQVAHMVIAANLISEGKFEELLARDPETQGIGPLVDGLIIAWAHMGSGAVSKALDQFDKVAKENGLRDFARYHKAMALASVGDYEGAEAIFAADDGRVARISRRAVLARAEVLSQLDRNGQALETLTQVFGTRSDPAVKSVADRLESGEKLPFTHVRSAADGMAEVFFTVGAALNEEAANDYVLIYARTASFLRPDHIDSLLLSAELLDELGQYELSVATYRMVPATSPDYHAAELGRAEALRRAAKPDAAIEVLEKLAQDHPTLPVVHSSLGDLLRQQEKYAEAVRAYDLALEHTEEGSGGQWFLHYARGICHERLKQWDKAEADFRAALKLNPDQPQVLNYLGYSLVERREKLDEALDMIQRAVKAQPDSGYIVDSLGWVLFRLGRYDEAVGHMERAVELMPVDPVVNDHLGDVYWAVGRAREAEFQWKRALSFIDPEDTDGEADPERIRRKLEIGLDAVLADEGADPLKVANDG
ncbi:tetratricopeptide repeat protein [Ruegeria sediminis]|uniref:tetratricopeptide repeat protein n=1 Tax=Ruegeria sediminis TaxID=2583820 RepID=UPI001FEC1D58|nr:tetratricopeptide repeat protein [Ruegeria sediminis]